MQEQDRPLVSVVIPSYNHERFVSKAVISVVNQTYPNIELIVVDDGSKDSSPELLKSLQEKYGFNLICRGNKGLSATLNETINNYTHGKYIRTLASDDCWPEDSVEVLVDYMEKHPGLGMACGWGIQIDAEDNVIDIKEGICPDISFEKLLERNSIMATATIFSKEAFLDIGGFDENLWIEDWDFWLRLSYKYPVAYIDHQIAYYRKHGTNISSREDKMIDSRTRTLEKWKGKIPDKLYNRIWTMYIFKYYRLLAGTHKKEVLKLLSRYRFRYMDGFVVKSFLTGTGKLLLQWNNR